MAKSAAAKELEAKQKAQIKAEKERRKNSTDPRDWSRTRQVRAVFDETRKYDPKLMPQVIAAVAVPVVLGVVGGILLVTLAHWHWINLILLTILGIMLGLLLGLQVLQSRAKGAQFKKYEGQAGSAEIALQMLGKDWQSKPAVAYNRQQDVVHRALGPGGLLLIGEGETGRVRSLLAQEVKRHEQALYGIKATPIIMGKGEGQVPLDQLTKHIKKLPKSLQPSQIEEASKRLAALDNLRSRMPLPKGPMPTRGSRQALRGR